MKPPHDFSSDPFDADSLHTRLRVLGSHNLDNAELLALLLARGEAVSMDSPAGELTRQLLTRLRSLGTLARCDWQELAALADLSPEQAALLVTAFELGRRLDRETRLWLKVDSPAVVCRLMTPEYRGLMRESLRVLLLDSKLHLLGIEEVALGSLNELLAHPREVFRSAVARSAFAVILTHNHPSGDPTPSQADRQLTHRIVAAGQVLDIEVADHIIVGAPGAGALPFYSFKEHGLI